MINRFAATSRPLAAVLAVSFALTGCATTKQHPDFAKRHEKMQNIVVTTPDTAAYEVTFNAGAKPLADLKALVEKSSTNHLEAVLKDKGYTVSVATIDAEKLEQDAALKEAWFDMQTLYKQALLDIAKNKKPSFTYEVGPGANYFADKYQANVLVLTRQTATKLSDGMIASQVAANAASIATTLLLGVSAGGSFQPWRSLTTDVAIVDADSGDILWYNLSQTQDDYTKPENDKFILAHIKTVLSAFPDAKSKPKKAVQNKASDKVASKPAGNNFAAAKAVAA